MRVGGRLFDQAVTSRASDFRESFCITDALLRGAILGDAASGPSAGDARVSHLGGEAPARYRAMGGLSDAEKADLVEYLKSL